MHKVRCSLLAVTVVALGTLPAASLAQARGLPEPRQLTVRLSPSGVRAPDVLAAGRYRLNVRAPLHAPAVLQLVKPDREYTRADLRADGRRGTRAAARRIRANIRFFGGAEVRAGSSGALWETLYAGRYWMVGFGAGRRGFSIKTVHVHGTPTLSSFPRVSAEATGTRKGLRLTRTTSQTGRMLIRNMSSRIDALVLLPLKKGVTYADFLRSLRNPDRAPPVRFRGARSTATLSPDAGYVLRYRLHPGNYVVLSISSLIAATGPHSLRRLFRPLTVLRHPGADSARTSVARGFEGFEGTPSVGRRIEHWLSTKDRDRTPLVERLAAGAVRHSLTRWGR